MWWPFLLYFNGYPAGESELSTKGEYLSQIVIQAGRR